MAEVKWPGGDHSEGPGDVSNCDDESDDDIGSYSDKDSSDVSCQSPQIEKNDVPYSEILSETLSELSDTIGEYAEPMASQQSPSRGRSLFERESERRNLPSRGDSNEIRGRERKARIVKRKKRKLQTSTPLQEREESKVEFCSSASLYPGYDKLIKFCLFCLTEACRQH